MARRSGISMRRFFYVLFVFVLLLGVGVRAQEEDEKSSGSRRSSRISSQTSRTSSAGASTTRRSTSQVSPVAKASTTARSTSTDLKDSEETNASDKVESMASAESSASRSSSAASVTDAPKTADADILLPTAVYDSGTTTTADGTPLPPVPSWIVEVPETWNFDTILNATDGYSTLQSEADAFLATPDAVFPDIEPMPLIFVNDSISIYATNALNYGLMSQLYVDTPYENRSDEVWSIPVVCEWPISGTFSRMNRVLYYFALIFALVVRRHEWLVAGALAMATTYSGAAAIQGWVQFGVITHSSNDSAGDNDNNAIIAILAAGLLMAVPLINWSRTLRKLQVRPILIYWAIIVLMGYILVVAGEGLFNSSRGWSGHAGGIMTCDTQELIPDFKDLGFIKRDFIEKYNCDDPCYNAKTMHPFHSPDTAISRLICDQFTWVFGDSSILAPSFPSCFVQCPRGIADDCYVAHDGWRTRDFKLYIAGYYGILPIIIIELFFVLCFGRKSPEEIRDQMFVFFVGRKAMGEYRIQSVEKQKLAKAENKKKIILAQTGAMVFYVLAVLIYCLCVPFFIFNIFWQEHLLTFFPNSEENYEPGQWLPWVIVALTLGAAIVGRYHHVWRVYLEHVIHGKQEKPPSLEPRAYVGTKWQRMRIFLDKKTWRTKERLRYEWRDLKEFIQNPVYLVLDSGRERTREHPTVKYSFLGNLKFPLNDERDCEECFRGPWLDGHACEKTHTSHGGWKNFPVEFFVNADDHTLRSWQRYMELNSSQQQNGMSSPRTSTANLMPQRGLEHIVYAIDLPAVPHYPDKRTVMVSNAQAYETDTVLNETFDPDQSGRGNTGDRLASVLTTAAQSPPTASYAFTPLDTQVSAPPQAAHQGGILVTRSLSMHSMDSGAAPAPPPKRKSTVVTVAAVPPSSSAASPRHPHDHSRPVSPISVIHRRISLGSSMSFSRPRRGTNASISTMASNASTSVLSALPADDDAPDVPQIPNLHFSTHETWGLTSTPSLSERPPSLPAPPPKDDVLVPRGALVPDRRSGLSVKSTADSPTAQMMGYYQDGEFRRSIPPQRLLSDVAETPQATASHTQQGPSETPMANRPFSPSTQASTQASIQTPAETPNEQPTTGPVSYPMRTKTVNHGHATVVTPTTTSIPRKAVGGSSQSAPFYHFQQAQSSLDHSSDPQTEASHNSPPNCPSPMPTSHPPTQTPPYPPPRPPTPDDDPNRRYSSTSHTTTFTTATDFTTATSPTTPTTPDGGGGARRSHYGSYGPAVATAVQVRARPSVVESVGGGGGVGAGSGGGVGGVVGAGERTRASTIEIIRNSTVGGGGGGSGPASAAGNAAGPGVGIVGVVGCAPRSVRSGSGTLRESGTLGMSSSAGEEGNGNMGMRRNLGVRTGSSLVPIPVSAGVGGSGGGIGVGNGNGFGSGNGRGMESGGVSPLLEAVDAAVGEVSDVEDDEGRRR
ncbi:hypothetical protein K402DRAFT_468012 [Aulographum hederae CBS 113979]|uniref:Uncharacterized protein n=1 Tax=Aulographum hederae CBS 113979 TaxID=1176131 RepID=A0A6G1GIY1_9PEZI|nr:hypothetical protein K402DRAFT_468012 [Aulographum hederae CBS 113979]